MNTLLLLLIAMMIPVFSILAFIPYWTRKTESFGVSIPEKIYHDSALRGMRKQYAVWLLILSFVTTVVFYFVALTMGNNEEMISILFTILFSLYMVGNFLIYLVFHRKMKQRKAKEKWGKTKQQRTVINTHFREQKLTYSNLWFLLSLMITLVIVAITFGQYNQMPEQIPMRYNLSGDVTNWADKSYLTVMFLPVIQVYLIAVFLFVNVVIGRAKQQVSAENPEESMRKNVLFRRRWSAYLIITGTFLTFLLSLIQLSMIYPIDVAVINTVSIVMTIGLIIGTIVLSVTTGQGGSRVKTIKAKDGVVIDRDEDHYWKLGIFYFNKDDPANFLEKRFGVGWTVNMARPLPWIILLVIIGISIALPILFGI